MEMAWNQWVAEGALGMSLRQEEGLRPFFVK